MIVKRRAARMRIRLSASGIFLIVFALAVASKSVLGASASNTTKKCGGDFSGYQYTISSPDYPEKYPENQDCVYTLRGSHLAKCDQVFHLQFLDFALKPSENCNEDYLTIGDRSLFCGSVVGLRSYPGKNNSLTLRFRSGAEARGGKGFKILVTTSPCASPQIEKQNDTNLLEQRPSEEKSNAANAEESVNKKIGTRTDLESDGLLEAENSYPVYRPEVDFANEDTRQFGREEKPPLRIESLEKNEKSILQRIEQSVPQNLANSLELPVHRSQLFRDPATTKLQIVTPVSIKSTEGPKISAYLFVPPESYEESTGNAASLRFSSANAPSKDLKKEIDNFVTPPPTEFLLPNQWSTLFRETGATNISRELPVIQDRARANQKFVVPARSYGVPDRPYYPPVQVSDPEIKTGEVWENSSGSDDCQGKNNLEPDLEVTANFRGKNNPALVDVVGTGSESGLRNNYHPATIYGAPGSNYPSNIPSFNNRPPTNNYFPANDVVTGSGRPDSWISSPGFPINNIGNAYPNFIPSPGIGGGGFYPGTINPGSGGKYSECCNTVYSAQRFLLASPGFPSILYSGNSYECVYTIRPNAPNICQMRFNFKFFNHGTEDRVCSYGYVEIDGRRICGCKKGLSIVSTVSTAFPKTIGVRYSGNPRTKFNGFLIEVVQEPCSNSYPFGFRRKKDVGNATSETLESSLDRALDVSNSSSRRTKRNLGYSYPKPSFGLIEVPGASSSWTSGGSVDTGIHQLLSEGGVAANLYSPLLTCQALSFFDWIIAAKEAYLRGARCVRNGGSGNALPGFTPGQSGNWLPGYPPSYPGIGGPGATLPPYPGNGGSGNWNPVFPGGGGSGNWNPVFPGGGGSGTIIPGYPGGGGSGGTIPGYPGTGGHVPINPGYPGSGSWNFPSTTCEDINVVEGIISSPQYPTNYPNNVRKCFRVYKAPGYCLLEVAFLDFDLENSPGCTKDYVAFSGDNRRYCGRTVAGSKTFLDISRTNIVEIYFVSDGFGTGRGFSAGLSQVPCRGSINQ